MRLLRTTMVLLGALWSARGFAAPKADERPSARIEYVAPPACPVRADLERAVAERLGYEPFREDAEASIRVTIRPAKNGKRFLAHIDVRKGTAPVGERDLPEDVDCAEVVRAAALMVALAIDPLSQGARSDRTEDGKAPSAPAPSAPPPPPRELPHEEPKPDVVPPPARPPSPPAHLHVQLGAGVSALRLPTLGSSLSVQAGLSLDGWSLVAEGRADLPFSERSDPQSGGTVSASTLSVAIVPCVERTYFFGCAVAELGALQGTGEGVKTPKRDTSPFFAAGIRAGIQVATEDRFFFRAHLEALAPVTRTTLGLNDVPVWTTPTVQLGFGLGAGRRF